MCVCTLDSVHPQDFPRDHIDHTAGREDGIATSRDAIAPDHVRSETFGSNVASSTAVLITFEKCCVACPPDSRLEDPKEYS